MTVEENELKKRDWDWKKFLLISET